MSPQPERKSPSPIKGDFTKIPNSVIEFQTAFPPAELRLLLMVLKWPGASISDERWEEWTGLKPRIKQMAIKGLVEKGLTVSSKGDKITFSFDVTRWDKWYPNWERGQRARTKGRGKSVTAKAGMQVHEQCRDSGCGRLCENNVIPFIATKFAQPVAQTQSEQSPSEAQFQQIVGTWFSLGVPLSEADIRKCGKIWNRLTPPEQSTAVSYMAARAEDDWKGIEARYIPRPWNYLSEKHWERRTPVQGRDKTLTKGQKAFESAAKRFMEEES